MPESVLLSEHMLTSLDDPVGLGVLLKSNRRSEFSAVLRVHDVGGM
jgi:hypothetical protein